MSKAREIAEERLARGEISADEFELLISRFDDTPTSQEKATEEVKLDPEALTYIKELEAQQKAEASREKWMWAIAGVAAVVLYLYFNSGAPDVLLDQSRQLNQSNQSIVYTITLRNDELLTVSVTSNSPVDWALLPTQADFGFPNAAYDYVGNFRVLGELNASRTDDKVGCIDADVEAILTRLSISPEHWVYLCTHFESRFKELVGSVHSLKKACEVFGRRRRPNLSSSKVLFT